MYFYPEIPISGVVRSMAISGSLQVAHVSIHRAERSLHMEAFLARRFGISCESLQPFGTISFLILYFADVILRCAVLPRVAFLLLNALGSKWRLWILVDVARCDGSPMRFDTW